MRDHPLYWDPRHPEYKDSAKKLRMLEQFGEQIGHSGKNILSISLSILIDLSVIEMHLERPAESIRRKWHGLRTSYARERAAHERAAAGTHAPKRHEWRYYQAMCFLRETQEPPMACVPLEPLITLEESPHELSPDSTNGNLRDISDDHNNTHLHQPHNSSFRSHHHMFDTSLSSNAHSSPSNSPPPFHSEAGVRDSDNISPSSRSALATLPLGLPPPPPLLPVTVNRSNKNRFKRNTVNGRSSNESIATNKIHNQSNNRNSHNDQNKTTTTSYKVLPSPVQKQSSLTSYKAKNRSSAGSRKRTKPEVSAPLRCHTSACFDQLDRDGMDDDDSGQTNQMVSSPGWLSPALSNITHSSRKSIGPGIDSNQNGSQSSLLSLNSPSKYFTLLPRKLSKVLNTPICFSNCAE